MFLSTTSLSFKFVQTPEGMQNLFEVLQEFTTWCGVEIKVNFFFLACCWQGSEAQRKHAGTRSEHKWRTSSTRSNQKKPTDAKIFCRILRTDRNRRLPVLGSPHQMVAVWLEGSWEGLDTSVYKQMARTVVNCTLSIHVFNRRGWPLVPPAVRSTHASFLQHVDKYMQHEESWKESW